MKRRILLIVCTACILLQAFAFPVSAAAVSKNYAVTDTSSVSEDLKHMVFEGETFSENDYPVNEDDSMFYLMRFLEVGYNGKGFGENAALYVFVYNPSLRYIEKDSPQNRITLSVGSDHTCSPYMKRDLIYCGASSDNRFLKYRVDLDAEAFELWLTQDKRIYAVSEIELYRTGLNATSFKVGGNYVYSGSGSDLYCRSENIYVIETALTSTYYRPETVSGSGENYRNELHSVYFSVPNRVFEKYGTIYSIQGEYYENRIMSIVTESKEYAGTMEFLAGTKVTELTGYEEKYQGSKKYPALYSSIKSYQSSCTVDHPLNVAMEDTFTLTWSRLSELERIPYIFNDIIVDEVAVTSAQLKNKVEEQGLFTTTGAANTEKTEYDISIEDGYKLESYADKHGDFATFLAQLRSWFDKDFKTTTYVGSAIAEVPADILLMKDETAANRFFVAESDIPALKLKYVDAALKDERVILLRYDQSEAVCYDMQIDAQDSGIEVDKDDETYLYEQNYYADFDVLSLTFKGSDGSLVTVPVGASPVDGVGGIVIRDDFPTLGELFERMDDDWWKPIVGVILVVLLLIVLFLIFRPLLKKGMQNASRKLNQWWRKLKASWKRKNPRK